jgi:class 3 adenylate cyclase/tetratricopeptide (TPR) repeat protein
MRPCPSCGEENPERARFCSSCGTGLEEAPRRAAEERKVVSVLFVDLVGFTATSEKADPEDVRARLRPYHARVKQEIERFGGTVEKFVGDAVMAVFGAPVSHEDDAERAVNAALRILAAIDELNVEHPDLELAVRGAVNSGEAMVTLSARPAEGEGMVAGDVVNTAARLQQHAPVGGIVVGEGTYRVTRMLFEYEPLEPVTAKGKGEALQLWHATAPRRRFGVDVEPIVQTPLIGRDDDLALLQSTYARTLRDASTQLLTITGEPGVGKTRLTAEFRRWVDDQPEIVFWRQGRSLPYGEGITYWALGEMIKAQAGILESDSPEDAAAKLAVAVGEVAEDETEVDWLEATLAPLVGASGTVTSSEREESFTAWRRFVEGIAAQRPLVLVFEDLHWADEALLAFIEHLVDWSTGVPLLVLCTARPELYERHAGWGGGKRNSNTVSLSPLAADDTARLLAALLHKAVLPAETQERLLEQAGGNPLYAEEFVRMLTDQGVIADGGELVDGDIRVPDTVQALIAARLDTLPPERKTLLHDASVVGKVFWTGIVAEMGDRDDSGARAGLHELARKELVRAARTSSVKDQAEYSFWHALVRDVAYSQIPRAERAQKHIAAAEWIERMAGERVTDHAELLAYHYTQALELTRAVGTVAAEKLEHAAQRFLVLAGDRAMSLDLVKANSYYRQALELFGTDELERGNVLMKLVDTRQGSIEEAETALQEALALFRAHGNEIREGAALRELGHWAYFRGDGEQSRQFVSDAIALLERHPPGEELASALTRHAGTFAVATQPHEALVATEAALRVVDELDLPHLRARLLQYRGIAHHDLGDIIDGVQDIRAGLELGRELGDLSTVGIGYSNLATILLSRSAQESADAYAEGIDFTSARGMNGNTRWLMAERTWPLYDLGRWDEIVRDVDMLLEGRGVGRGYLTIIALTQKALVLLERGRTEEAAPLVDDVLPRAREAKDLQVLVPALATSAALAVAAGQLASAEALAREVEEITREGAAGMRARHLPELVSIALVSGASDTAHRLLHANYFDAGRPAHAVVAARAVVAEFNDKPAEALELYEDAAARWSEYGSVLERANALFGAGRALIALGRPHEATARLQEARTLYQDLGATPSVGRVDDALARATSVSA